MAEQRTHPASEPASHPLHRTPTRWWHHAPRAATLALLAVIAAAVLGTFSLIVATVEAERVQRLQAARTSAVLAALSDIVSATLNGETAQRGYFITNDRRYLEPFYRGRAEYARQSAELRLRLEDDGEERLGDLADSIRRTGDAKWAELSGTIALVEQGRVIDAQQRIFTDEGQSLMVRLNAEAGQLERIERARLDATIARARAAEARILPFLSLLLGVVVVALATGLWLAIRAARAEALAANAREISAARDRADLLARELNHRVKNLFAVILAIVRMSARGDAGAAPAVERIASRIHALVTAHDVTQGAPGESEVDIADLVGKAIAPYRSATERCELAGGTLVIPGRHAVPLGLVLHELVTNAVKYGAWSAPGGLLSIGWRTVDDRVELVWRETCGEAHAADRSFDRSREGFGSMLIRSSERQLGGTIARRFEPDGIVVEIAFPLVPVPIAA